MIRLYRWLLLLYPADYRAIFAEEMTKVFDEARTAALKRGPWQSVAFCLRELTGLVWTASSAHLRIHSRWADRVKDFTHGKAAVPRLIFTFAAMVAVIAILKSFLPHRRTSQPMLWSEFLLVILAGLTMVFGGATGWAFAFLFGRTGLQRIANLDTKSGQK